MLERETKTSYVFKLYRLEVGGGLKELGVELWISRVGRGEGITYTLIFDAERWRDFFGQKLEAAVKAAVEVGGRLPVEDRLPYMLGWVASDVAINRRRNERVLQMSTSHLWQFAETHALFGWSAVGLRVSLTLEGPKLQVIVEAPLDKLNEAVRKSAEGGWLKTLGIRTESWDGLRRWVVENWDVVVEAAVRRLGEEVRGELMALKNKLDDDKAAREVVASALLLIQAEKLGVNETTLKYFGAVVSGAIGGDGHVSTTMGRVGLTSGEREIALLWATALAAYGVETEARYAGRKFDVVASGDDAVKLAGLYFLYGPPLLEGGDDMLKSHKLDEAVRLGAKEALNIRWEGLRRAPSGLAAAELTISEGSTAVKYNVYLSENAIELNFQSTDRSRAELAARLLRLAGIGAEVKKVKVGGRDVWRVRAYTDKLAAGHEGLRKALAEIVKTAHDNGWVDAGKAKRWLEKLEKGLTLEEGWPRYHVGLKDGALVVKFGSTDSDKIKQETRRMMDMGLEEGRHFTVKMPEGGDAGYLYIRREGLERAAWLSVYGSGRQRELAAAFVEYILERAEKADDDVHEKVREIIEEGKAWSSLKLEGFEGRVEVDGKTYVVKVIGGGAVEEDRGGRKLLRIRITVEVGRVEGEHTIVDRVVREYTITYGRYGDDNETRGFAYASANAPGDRKADAERFSALIKALTGREPRVYQRSDGDIEIVCGREHLEGFMRYTELAEAIKKWLEETSRQ